MLSENRSPSGNHWLKLSLEGTRCNRDAVGARLQVVLATEQGERVLHRAVGSVSSFGGSPHRLEIGLGTATAIQRIEVRWPGDGESQLFTDVPLDAWIVVREGDKGFERREVKVFHF